MELSEAVQIVLADAAHATLRPVARRIGCSVSTLSGWSQGVNVSRKYQKDVLRVAHEIQNGMPTPHSSDMDTTTTTANPLDGDVIAVALRETAANIKRLGQIQGYAQAVLEQLEDAAKRQRAVVQMLSPHVDREAAHLALRLQQAHADDAESAALRAELDVGTTPPGSQPAVPPHPRASSR
jgi:DNA-binding LacI/PurR family transcriptional regulator